MGRKTGKSVETPKEKKIRNASEREADRKVIEEKKRKLKEEMSKLEDEEEQIHQEELQERRVVASKKLEYLRENKEIILSLLEHSRTSCSDEHPCNGYSFSSENARCDKCYLMEILEGDWGDSFEIDFSVNIREIK